MLKISTNGIINTFTFSSVDGMDLVRVFRQLTSNAGCNGIPMSYIKCVMASTLTTITNLYNTWLAIYV